ncbi:hypothetical protein WJ27_06840 [Burkholderia thailandensis]|nr:hypothetical protein WJ27_06840 [Burkholderia thailandensis]
MLVIFLTLKSKSSTLHRTMLEEVQHLTLVFVSCLDKLRHRGFQQWTGLPSLYSISMGIDCGIRCFD